MVAAAHYPETGDLTATTLDRLPIILTVFLALAAAVGLASLPKQEVGYRAIHNTAPTTAGRTAVRPEENLPVSSKKNRGAVTGSAAAAAAAGDVGGSSVLRALDAELRALQRQEKQPKPQPVRYFEAPKPQAASYVEAPTPVVLPTSAPVSLPAKPVSGKTGPVKPEDEISRNERSGGVLRKVRPGSVVSAPEAGTVAYAGPFRDYGRVVILRLRNSPRYLIIAGDYRLRITSGVQVQAGQTIGIFGIDRSMPFDLYTQIRSRPGASLTATNYIPSKVVP